jgi:catechol 2,3-dioxygenase-like lactoylglutathione lyase family enzyme
MRYTVSIDVPSLEEGIRFYCEAFGFVETGRPVETYAVLKYGDAEIGLLEKAAGTNPADGSDDVRRYERHWTPVHVDFTVENFDEALQRTLDAGARCERTFEGGDHPPVAFCSDPFGNGFCVIGQRTGG